MARSGRYITQAEGYKAFIPTQLPPKPPIKIEDETLHQFLSEANIALGRLDTMGQLLPNIDYIIAMYVRKEALLSSQIEGTQASLEDIFEYESDEPIKNIQDVQEVVNYIRAMSHGLKRIEEFPMSVRLIKEIHALLLEGARGKEKTSGEFRRTQNWIGSPGSSLKNASFVPPPPKEAIDAMSELEKFFHVNNSLPILITCALIHYQFETIHPFLDGNGRLGRLLITFYLCWKGVVKEPLLYLSYYFKLHKQEYYDRLNLVRDSGDYEQWVVFFLKGIIWTSDSAFTTTKKVLDLREKNKQLLIQTRISSPLAVALLDFLFVKPFCSIDEVSKQLDVSFPSAQALVNKFLKLNILKEITGKRRDRRFCYWEYVDYLSEGTSFKTD